MYNPIKTLKTNALGTLNLLGKHILCTAVYNCIIVLVGLAKRVRARFLLASTSEVYGGACVSLKLSLFIYIATVLLLDPEVLH